MIVFLSSLPFYYLFKSRLKSKLEQFSWFIIYPIPLLYLVLFPDIGNAVEITLLFIIALAAFYSIYEIGYLENDLRTALAESNPTLRMPEDERALLSRHYKKLVLSKWLACLFFSGLIVFVSGFFEIAVYPVQFISCVLLVRLCFYLHNTIRNRFNTLTYAALSVVKYSSPILLFIDFNSAGIVLLVSVIMFPLIRTLESATNPKYGFVVLPKLLGNHDVFRVKYYLFFSLVVIFLSLFSFHYAYLVFVYFLLARCAGLFLIRFKGKEVDKFRKYKNIADKPNRESKQEGNENR